MRVVVPCMQIALAASSPSRVAVTTRVGQHAVIANADIECGDTVLVITGREVAAPTRYTLQIGRQLHIEAQPDGDGPDGYPVWRFLNHGCVPNVALRGRAFVALAPIRAGEEVTFDYDTTEWDMASPFRCHCGNVRCRGEVRGFRHLTAAARAALQHVAPHLRALA